MPPHVPGTCPICGWPVDGVNGTLCMDHADTMRRVKRQVQRTAQRVSIILDDQDDYGEPVTKKSKREAED